MTSSEKASGGREDEIDVVQLVRIFWRYKYVVIVVTVLFLAASIALALTATHKYSAQVVVTDADSGGLGATGTLASQFGGLAGMAGVDLLSGGMGKEAQAVLESRNLIAEFIKRNDLLSEVLHGDAAQSTWFAARRFQETVLTINEDTAEGVITVAIEWTEPATAARWANEFVALANELMRARALEDATRNIEFLNKQIERTTVVEVQRAIYSLIESETKNLMLANVRSDYAFRVVDPAVPPEIRSSPRRKVMVLSGAAIGLFAGLLLALLLDFISHLRSGAASG